MESQLDLLTIATQKWVSQNRNKLVDNIFSYDPFIAMFGGGPRVEDPEDPFDVWVREQRKAAGINDPPPERILGGGQTRKPFEGFMNMLDNPVNWDSQPYVTYNSAKITDDEPDES